jgi:hypothetical protein
MQVAATLETILAAKRDRSDMLRVGCLTVNHADWVEAYKQVEQFMLKT